MKNSTGNEPKGSTNKMSRRDAMKVVGGSAAGAGLASSAHANSDVREAYSRDVLDAETNKIVEYVTSQDFLSELRSVLDAPQEDQFAEAAKRFNPATLEEKGLRAPENTRISSRVFDEETGQQKIFGDVRSGVGVNFSIPRDKLNLADIKTIVDGSRFNYAGDPTARTCVCVGYKVCIGAGTE